MALPLVLLLLLALTGLSHGVLLLALQDRAASSASRALLQARLLAEAGVRRAVAQLAHDTVPAGDTLAVATGTVPGGGYQVALRPLGGELLWVEGAGEAWLAPGPSGQLGRATYRTARILWALTPRARLAEVRAVVEHGGGLLASPLGVDGSSAGAILSLDAPRGCRDRRLALDSILPSGVLPEERRAGLEESLTLPRLGLLPLDTLLVHIPISSAGVVTPDPVVELDRCVVETTGNWGSPLAPEGPCGGHRPPVAASGDLELRGGQGQGLLVVRGDLTISEGARYEGLVLVGGTLRIGAGAELRGLAQVRGRVQVEDGGRVTGAICPALLALEAATSLRRPVPLPGSGWIGPL